MSSFRERLSELMFYSNDIKSESLGNKLGLSGATIRRWLSGNQQIRLSNLIILADYFKCSLEFIAGRTDNKLDFTLKPCPPFYESFRNVLKQNKITRYRFIKETRFKDQYFSKWKKGADPQLETLTELADYFNCTLDYLVGRE